MSGAVTSPRPRRLWITWERQRRNRALSAALDAELHEIHVAYGRAARYLIAIQRTVAILKQRRPEIVFVQNPSIILALVAMLWCRLTGAPIVVDAHNAGVHPFEGRRAWANRLARFLFRQVSLTLVSNGALAEYVERSGGAAFVLPDPLPVLTPASSEVTAARSRPARVIFVCAWADDEPYLELIEAARHLGQGVTVSITGASRGRERAGGSSLPENVRLTGFLDDAAYDELLCESNLVIDLTTRQDCLVCGAYEAMAAGRPLLVSDTVALRSYFDRGTLFTDNSAADIAAKIREALAQLPHLTTQMHALRQTRVLEWETTRRSLEARLLELLTRSR